MALSRTSVVLASAAALAATATVIRASARRTERVFPAEGRFIEAGGIRLHYLEAGAGDPAIVLLHGNAVLAQDFTASGLSGLLARRHRVLSFDRPGYGYSERPRDRLWTPHKQAALLAEALARLGIERPIVVGHSWGTLVALALALRDPQKLRGLVLMSGYHFPTPRRDVAIFAPAALPVVGDVLRYTVSPIVGRLLAPRMIRRMFAPCPVPPAFAAAVPVPMMLRPWQIKASAEDAAFMIPAAGAMLPRLGELGPLPVAIVAGSDDQIVDRIRHSHRLHAMLPGSSLDVVPGVGHMVHHGSPALIADLIEAMAAGRHAHPGTGARRLEPEPA